jgi:5-methylcytosine-specific restriction endonuclease McrA
MNISNYMRNFAIMRTYGRCAYCGKPIIDEKHGATFDHILPLSKKGTTSKDNLFLCCFDCNQEKGSLSLEDYRQKKMLSLQKLIKRNGLVIKATGNVKFFFERLETTDIAKKIEEMLNDV